MDKEQEQEQNNQACLLDNEKVTEIMWDNSGSMRVAY